MDDVYLIKLTDFQQERRIMALIMQVKVVPGSSQRKCVLDLQRVLKCYVQSAAQDGKANQELIQLFSKTLRCPRSAITILAGHTARIKRIKIDIDIDYAALLQAFDIKDAQNAIF